MTTQPGTSQRPPVKDWRSVMVFDGRGGVKRLDESEEDNYTIPARGFSVVAGNVRAPEFKVWLKADIGDFNAELLTVPNTRTRCTVLEDKAMVVLRVRAALRAAEAGQRFCKLNLAVAVHTGHTEYLPAADLET